MARFRGTQLYLRAASRDVSFGSNVRALLSAAGVDSNFTVTFTSTTAIAQTVSPFTNISNQSADNRAALGWALNQNEASADGMGSGVIISGVGNRRRVIPAGVWSFAFGWSSNAPALLANYDVAIEYSVYRVAANGGARSLLFTANAASVNVTLVAGSGNGAATSASQPAFTISDNETIHVAVRITSKATSSALGGTTNTVITCTGATSGALSVAVPSNGIRDIFYNGNDATGESVSTRAKAITKDTFAGAGVGAGEHDYLAEFFRSFNSIGEGESERAVLTVKKFAEATGCGVGARMLGVIKAVSEAQGYGSAEQAKRIRKAIAGAEGIGSGELTKAAIFVRAFLAAGDGAADMSRVVIFVRKFGATGEATIRPRITLDWDDLPSAGGGGEVINNYFRPVFVFDD
jgi:hypothetical protein